MKPFSWLLLLGWLVVPAQAALYSPRVVSLHNADPVDESIEIAIPSVARAAVPLSPNGLLVANNLLGRPPLRNASTSRMTLRHNPATHLAPHFVKVATGNLHLKTPLPKAARAQRARWALSRVFAQSRPAHRCGHGAGQPG